MVWLGERRTQSKEPSRRKHKPGKCEYVQLRATPEVGSSVAFVPIETQMCIRDRDECLNANWFRNLMDARAKIGAWREEYNGERPHSSLGYRTPNEFAAILKSSVMTG